MAIPNNLVDLELAKYFEAEPGVTAVRVGSFDPAFEEREERVNSVITFYGRSHTLGALSSDSTWRIWRVVRIGNEYVTSYADDSDAFTFTWDDRETYFDDPVLDNPASILFDGVDEDITLGDNYTFGPATAFSWSLWVKAQNVSVARRFISKATSDGLVYGYNFGHDASGNLFGQMRAAGFLTTATFTSAITAGTWYHLCFTFSGNSNINGLKAYINGTLATHPSSGSLGAWTVTEPLKVGSRNGSLYFSGNINNVSVWNKALTSTEVTELYNSGSPGDLSVTSMQANLLSWWGLNDSSTFPTVLDLASSVNGTMTNMEVGDFIDGDVP